MSENKAFTLKLDIKVYSNLSAIIFSTNQRSLVFGNCGVIPSEAPKLSQANIRVHTQCWSFKMWEQQAWFKCASHHLGAKKIHVPNISCPSRFATAWKIWVNNYKRLAWGNCVYMAGPKTQRWWLSKKSSLFWAVYGFYVIQRPLPTSKTIIAPSSGADHVQNYTKAKTSCVPSQQRPKPRGFVVTSIEQLLAGTGAVLDKPLFGVLGWPHLSTAAPGLEMFSLASLNQGLDAVLSANQAVFSHNLPPTRAGESCGGTGLTAAIGSKAQLVPGGTHIPVSRLKGLPQKKISVPSCPQVSQGASRSCFHPQWAVPACRGDFCPSPGRSHPLPPQPCNTALRKICHFSAFLPKNKITSHEV